MKRTFGNWQLAINRPLRLNLVSRSSALPTVGAKPCLAVLRRQSGHDVVTIASSPDLLRFLKPAKGNRRSTVWPGEPGCSQPARPFMNSRRHFRSILDAESDDSYAYQIIHRHSFPVRDVACRSGADAESDPHESFDASNCAADGEPVTGAGAELSRRP